MSEPRAADALEGDLVLEAAAAPEPPAAPGRFVAPHAPWRDVALLSALTAFGSVAMDMYLPALPQITRALHATPAAGQATISVFLGGLAIGQLAYGPLSDRWGRRAGAFLGIALYGLASLGCLVASDMGAMTLARLLQALGASGGGVIARAVVRDRYADHEVIHVYALLSLVFAVAPIAAPLVGGLVLEVAGWRWIFGVQLGFAVAVAAWAFVALPESRSPATRELARSERPLKSYLALLAQPRLVGYLLTGGCAGAALFAYIASAPEVLITLYHVPPDRFGWVFGANAVGLTAAGQLNARLARRISPIVLLRASLVCAIAAALVMLACAATGFGGAPGVLVPLFLVLAATGFTNPNTTAGAMTVDRDRAGATAALLGAVFFGVGGLAGLAVGRLHDGTARPMAIVILGGLVLALAALELTVAGPLRRSGAASGRSTP